MDGIIKINDQEYDPYYVLDSTPEDTDEHISKMFKKKVKVFHPDKIKRATPEKLKKYELYMQIILESYEWIKKRRQTRKRNDDFDSKQYKQLNEEELSKIFSKVEIKDETQRFSTVDDYKNFNETITNVFKDKKFTNEEFNDIFEYFKEQHDVKNIKTTTRSNDGFYCNDNNTNFATVSSYNGLLISSDVKLGDGNILENNDDNNCYKTLYNYPKNPNKLPTKLSKSAKTKDETLSNDIITKKINEHSSEIKNVHKYTNFVDEKKNLHDKIYRELLEKEEHDKQIIEKYASKLYDNNIVEQFKNGELESSPTFLSKLKEHHKLLRD